MTTVSFPAVIHLRNAGGGGKTDSCFQPSETWSNHLIVGGIECVETELSILPRLTIHETHPPPFPVFIYVIIPPRNNGIIIYYCSFGDITADR